jgi:hypothetical protein
VKVEFKDRNGKDLEIGQKVRCLNSDHDGQVLKLKASVGSTGKLRVMAVVEWWCHHQSDYYDPPYVYETYKKAAFNPTNLEVIE